MTFNYDELDPGIREVVRLLRSHGFETTDSGDGTKPQVDGCTMPFPHVAMRADIDTLVSGAHRAADLLRQHVGEGWRVEASYSTADAKCLLLAMKE